MQYSIEHLSHKEDYQETETLSVNSASYVWDELPHFFGSAKTL